MCISCCVGNPLPGSGPAVKFTITAVLGSLYTDRLTSQDSDRNTTPLLPQRKSTNRDNDHQTTTVTSPKCTGLSDLLLTSTAEGAGQLPWLVVLMQQKTCPCTKAGEEKDRVVQKRTGERERTSARQMKRRRLNMTMLTKINCYPVKDHVNPNMWQTVRNQRLTVALRVYTQWNSTDDEVI